MSTNDIDSELSNYKVVYEEEEYKGMSTATKPSRKPSSVRAINRSTKNTPEKTGFVQKVSERAKTGVKSVQDALDRTLKKNKTTRKKSKKSTKAERDSIKKQRLNVILGIGLLLVVVSIAYSTSVVYIGVDSDASRLALAPQLIFALIITFKAFSKILK